MERTDWTDLDQANQRDGHYRRSRLKPVALRNADRAYEKAHAQCEKLDRLYDAGHVPLEELLIALEAERLIFELKSLLTDLWWIDCNMRANEYDAGQGGLIGCRIQNDQHVVIHIDEKISIEEEQVEMRSIDQEAVEL